MNAFPNGHFSVSGIVGRFTRNRKRLWPAFLRRGSYWRQTRRSVHCWPPERLLLETDAPFCPLLASGEAATGDRRAVLSTVGLRSRNREEAIQHTIHHRPGGDVRREDPEENEARGLEDHNAKCPAFLQANHLPALRPMIGGRRIPN